MTNKELLHRADHEGHSKLPWRVLGNDVTIVDANNLPMNDVIYTYQAEANAQLIVESVNVTVSSSIIY